MKHPPCPPEPVLLLLVERYSYAPDSGILTYCIDVGRGNNARKAGDAAGYAIEDDNFKALYVRFQYGGRRWQFNVCNVGWFLHYCNWPRFRLRHLNCDGTDNRIGNLVEEPNLGNNRRAVAGASAGTRTGLKYVYYHETANGRTIYAQVRNGRENVFLGFHPTETQAKAVADAYVAKTFGVDGQKGAP